MANSRDAVVPLTVQDFNEALIDPTKLHCVDCGGWPLDNGAVFVAVFLVKNGKAELGGICESCWLNRLQRRGQIINATSSECSQVELPELGLHKRRR
jgi:hypothetical protein